MLTNTTQDRHHCFIKKKSAQYNNVLAVRNNDQFAQKQVKTQYTLFIVF